MEWGDWFQQQAGSVLDKYATAQFTQPYEIQRMQLQAMGQGGYYTEGQPGMLGSGTIAGMPTSTVLLLGGAALLAIMLLKD